MSIFCITGQVDELLISVETHLQGCGVAPHGPLARDPSFDLIQWHQRWRDARSSQAPSGQTLSEPAHRPSRLWEQLAIDLIVANMHKAHWSWAHAGSVELLDFWAQLDPDIRFVLVCEDRLSLVCRLIGSDAAIESIPAQLLQWEKCHQSMLRFHLRNPHASLLVWGSAVQDRPRAWMEHLQKAWSVSLDLSGLPAPKARPRHGLLEQMAGQLLRDHPQTAALDFELQSILGALGEPVASEPAMADLVGEYRRLLDRSAEHQQIARARQEMQALQAAHDRERLNASAQQDHLQSLLAAETQAKQAALAQIGQAQQALAQAQAQREKEKAANQDTRQKLADEHQAHLAVQKRCETETAAKHDALRQIKNLQQEADLLLQQLHQVQEELAQQFSEQQSLQKDCQAETQAKQAALTQLGQAQKTLAQAQAQLEKEKAAHQATRQKLADEHQAHLAVQKRCETETAAKQDALRQIKNLQEETDLLLQQLHQVQEELESYFLKHQEKQHEVKRLQDRWLRAVQKHPALQDFEVMDLLSESSADHTAHWRVHQLNVLGQTVGPFEFKTFIEKGVAGFVFGQDARGQSPIKRWPAAAAQDKELQIIPVKGTGDPKKRSATILQLGSSDWHMVRQLTDTLAQALATGVLTPQHTDAGAWVNALNAQKQILDKVPTLMRFDAVKFLGQKNTTAKSVLALQLHNTDVQGLRAEQFEFQLQLNFSAQANLSSAHLIFEQPTQGVPLAQWHSNVKNSSGQAVMALQISPSGWAPATWHRLSLQDQQWVQALVSLLPILWATLQAQSVKPEKGWATLASAATELRSWSQLPVAAAVEDAAQVLKKEVTRLTFPEPVASKARSSRKAAPASQRKTRPVVAKKTAPTPAKSVGHKKKPAPAPVKSKATPRPRAKAAQASKPKRGGQ